MLPGLIEHHREVCAPAFRWPGRNFLTRDAIDDIDRSGTRHVDEYPSRITVELKALWMSIQRHGCDLAMRRGINDGQCTIAMTDDPLSCLGADPDVVCFVPNLDLPTRRRAAAVVKPHRAVASVCNIERVGRLVVTDALRLWKTADEPINSLGSKIDD